MKTTMIKILSSVFCLVICLCLIPSSFADGDIVASGICGAEGDNLTWTLDSDGVFTISGTGAMKDYSEGSSPPWLFYFDKIKSVQVENGVTSIGSYAFYGIDGYITLHKPHYVGCKNLSTVSLPCTITQVGRWAFAGSSSLTAVTSPVWHDYTDCPVTSITIPDGVSTIVVQAFFNFSKLESISIPDGVTEIGREAFFGCSNLTTISLPKSIEYISIDAFRDCSSMSILNIEDLASWCGVTMRNNHDHPFSYSKTDTSLYINGALATELKIPDNVKSIKAYTFENCDSLTSLSIPSSVEYIAVGAFAYCSNLHSIRFFGSPPRIPIDDTPVFGNVTATAYYPANQGWETSIRQYGGTLTWIPIDEEPVDELDPDCILPATLSIIEEGAFSGCTFQYVVLSENTLEIQKSAFSNCRNLKLIYIPEATRSIDKDAFSDDSGFIIIGKSGSYAETYALENGFDFSPQM